MRVCHFILLPSVARAVTTTSVSGMSNPFTPLAHLTDIAEHRNDVLVNGMMKAGEVGNREERVLAIKDCLRVDELVKFIRQQKNTWRKAAAAKRFLTKLENEEHVQGLGEWDRVANEEATPKGALGSALADTYGNKVMAQALVRASIKLKGEIGPRLKAVQDAMIAHWSESKSSAIDVLQWLRRNKPSSDNDLFDHGIAELLTGAHTGNKPLAEVFLIHFDGDRVRLFAALVRAEKKKAADQSAIKACWDWLRSTHPDYSIYTEAFRDLLDPGLLGNKWVVPTDRPYDWPTDAEKKDLRRAYEQTGVWQLGNGSGRQRQWS